MSAAYVEEFVYRGRDPEHEPGLEATFHVRLAQWVAGPDGVSKPLHTGAMTPAQATAAGFPLDAVLGAMTAQAVLERDAAKSEAAALQAELASTKADWTEMAAQLKTAESVRDDAIAVANKFVIAHAEVSEANAALLKQVNDMPADDAPQPNKALQFVSFGLLGN